MTLRILLVDQNPDRAAMVGEALRGAGYEIVQIVAGTDNLATLITQTSAEVVIVDLDLPDRDTIEDLREVSRDAPRPVVMFVDRSDESMMREAITAGVTAYVVDGLQAKRIKPVLEVAIARFQAFDSLRRELEETKTTLAERKLLDRAKGILMTSRGMTESEAYHALRKAAMNQNRRVADVARSVVDLADLMK